MIKIKWRFHNINYTYSVILGDLVEEPKKPNQTAQGNYYYKYYVLFTTTRTRYVILTHDN